MTIPAALLVVLLALFVVGAMTAYDLPPCWPNCQQVTP